MSKRIKIKKQVYYILIGIILIIGASIFGNYKYKEYKYHQTYEYKLLNHGYKNEDVTKILNNFSEKDYNYFLNNDVNENYIKLLDEKYFLKKNFYKYIEYINKNKKLDLTSVVRNINIHLDKNFYEEEFNTDVIKDTSMLVNKYYLLGSDYAPSDLVTISQTYSWGDAGSQKTRKVTYDAFLEMWNAVSEKATNDTDFSKYIIHYDYKAQQTGFVQPYADSPMDNEQVGEEVYISMINKAEKYCWFMTPYLIITDEMTHALCLAAKRGVDVRIITPGIPDKKFIYNVTRSFYHGLVKHGVRVYEWTPGFCHAKMSVADDCMATCGTINLDYRSLYHHFENGCFMADCQAVVEIKNDLIRTMGECRDVTDQYQTGRSAYLRLGQLFMRLFAGLL